MHCAPSLSTTWAMPLVPSARQKPATSNGKSDKTVLTGEGPLRLHVSRDRGGGFQPMQIPKHERCFTGFDDKIIAMYTSGISIGTSCR